MLSPRSHPHIANAEQAIIVVVDMQEPFLRTIFERERVIANVERLLKGAKILRVPSISTVQNQKAMGDVLPEIRSLLPSPPLDKMTFRLLRRSAVLDGAGPLQPQADRAVRRREPHLCGPNRARHAGRGPPGAGLHRRRVLADGAELADWNR